MLGTKVMKSVGGQGKQARQKCYCIKQGCLHARCMQTQESGALTV